MSQATPITDAERKLRTVRYVRHPGPWHQPVPMENSLLAFVYDVPYFGACGVFPPIHLLNLELRRGGSQGGMSPGATWEPFELSPEEYRDLIEAVRTVPVESLRGRARYAHLAFTFDPAFDGPPETYPVRREPKRWDKHIPADYEAYVEWSGAVCAKHRERWHAELKRAGFLREGPPSTDLVPETAIDYEEVFRRGGRNLGDEGFTLFKCPSCGRVYLIDYEVYTVYLDAEDLSKRSDADPSLPRCVECRYEFRADEPVIGPKADLKFGVTWADLSDSPWNWIAGREHEGG